MPPTDADRVTALVDHLFRHRSGQMIAALTRIFGPANLVLAEDVVQEALARALRLWPYRGIPGDPAGWLFTVAKNAALDATRRRSAHRRHSPEIASLTESRLNRDPARLFESEMAEDQLRMMFMCCHPDIAPESRIALTLKTVGGFSVAEIAQAFLAVGRPSNSASCAPSGGSRMAPLPSKCRSRGNSEGGSSRYWACSI